MAIVLQPDASSPAWSRRPTNSRPLAAREFVFKVEDELQKFRDGVLALMDKNLIPSAIAFESKMSHYAMAGGYYRHLAELAAVETKRKTAKDACEADAEATKITEKSIDEVVEMSMVSQRQLPVTQQVLKTVEIPQVQHAGKISDVSVVTQRVVPTFQTVQKTREAPQTQVQHAGCVRDGC